MISETRPHTVLVVDDDEVARMLLEQALDSMGYRTVLAGSAESAWDLLQCNHDICFACIDWMLPGMSGPELCGRIKQEIRDRYVHTVMVTSKAAREDLIAAIESGADDFLSKPPDMGELLCRIHAGERVIQYDKSLRAESEKTDRLLESILPASIAQRMKKGEMRIADHIDECSVMFVDICGFTATCMRVEAEELIAELERLFNFFDDRIQRRGVEKIKSIGDAYLIAAGVPEPDPEHAVHLVETALDLNRGVRELGEAFSQPIRVRTGIASGPVVAGVIGRKRFIYDVWGPTVNLANRLESMAPEGGILVDARHRELLGDRFPLRARGTVTPKGFRPQAVWELG